MENELTKLTQRLNENVTMEQKLTEAERDQRDKILAAQNDPKMLKDHYALDLKLIRVMIPRSVEQDEFNELHKQWEEVWPEVLDLLRKKAAGISHKMKVRYDP